MVLILRAFKPNEVEKAGTSILAISPHWASSSRWSSSARARDSKGYNRAVRPSTLVFASLLLPAACLPGQPDVEAIEATTRIDNDGSRFTYRFFATLTPPSPDVTVQFKNESVQRSAVTNAEGRAAISVSSDKFEGDRLTVSVGSQSTEAILNFEPKLGLSEATENNLKAGATVLWSVRSPLGDIQGIPNAERFEVVGVESVAVNGGPPKKNTGGRVDVALVVPDKHVHGLEPVTALDDTLTEEEANFRVGLVATLPSGTQRDYELEVEVKTAMPISRAVRERIDRLQEGEWLEKPVSDDELSLWSFTTPQIIGSPPTLLHIDYFVRYGRTVAERATGGKCQYQGHAPAQIVLVDTEIELVSTRDGSVVAQKVFNGQKSKCPFQIESGTKTVRMTTGHSAVKTWLRAEKKKLNG